MKLEGHLLKTMLDIIPLNRLVIETDAPYMGFNNCRMLEAKMRKSRFPNSPLALLQINQKIATVLNLNPTEVARITTENCLNFFGIERRIPESWQYK